MKAFCLSLIASAAAAAAAAAGMDQTLYARQTTALEVDFTEFPTCANVCLTRWRALSCPTNPPTLSCFCSLPSPLSCATSAESACWSSAESWYATQCPSVPAVNTTAIPTCAQSCFEKENTHCVNDLTRNCVCSWGQPDCAGGCTKDDATLWESWWQGECEYNTTFSSSTTTAATGTTATATGTSTASSTATATGTGTAVPNNGGGGGGGGGRGRGRTGTIVGAAVGGLAGTLAIGGLVFWLCRGGRKQVPDKDSAAAGAGGHGGLLGPDGRQIVEMGTDGGVQRVRPVEEVIAEMESPMEAPVGWGGAARGKVYEKA